MQIQLQYIIVHDEAMSDIRLDRIDIPKPLCTVHIQTVLVKLITGQIHCLFALLLRKGNRLLQQDAGQSLPSCILMQIQLAQK